MHLLLAFRCICSSKRKGFCSETPRRWGPLVRLVVNKPCFCALDTRRQDADPGVCGSCSLRGHRLRLEFASFAMPRAALG